MGEYIGVALASESLALATVLLTAETTYNSRVIGDACVGISGAVVLPNDVIGRKLRRSALISRVYDVIVTLGLVSPTTSKNTCP